MSNGAVTAITMMAAARGPQSEWIDANASNPTVRWAHLFELYLPNYGGGTTLRWTDDMLPIFYGGQTYAPYVVSVDTISTEQGMTAAANLEVGNADKLFGTYLFGTDMTGSVVKVWQAWLRVETPSPVPYGVRQVFLGRVFEVSFSRSGLDSMVKLSLGPYSDPSTKLMPARTVADLLRH